MNFLRANWRNEPTFHLRHWIQYKWVFFLILSSLTSGGERFEVFRTELKVMTKDLFPRKRVLFNWLPVTLLCRQIYAFVNQCFSLSYMASFPRQYMMLFFFQKMEVSTTRLPLRCAMGRKLVSLPIFKSFNFLISVKFNIFIKT